MSGILTRTSNNSEITPFRVYFTHNQSTLELKFNDNRMRTEQLINQCIRILEDQYLLKIDKNYMHYALFPANKKGGKQKNSAEISHYQRIRSMAGTKFYLEYLNFSKESISTTYNFDRKFGLEKGFKKQLESCCSIFSGL